MFNIRDVVIYKSKIWVIQDIADSVETAYLYLLSNSEITTVGSFTNLILIT